jgi:trimeric autotransporter adhesin
MIAAETECNQTGVMKIKTLLPITIAFYVVLVAVNPATAQGTAFTYQGRLSDGANPANGIYELTFAIYTNSSSGTAIAGPLTNSATVTNGLFTVLIDFGTGVFTGASTWLEISARTNGAGAFSTLTPRQALTPSPYSIYTEGVPAAGIYGTLTDGQLPVNLARLNVPNTASQATGVPVITSGFITSANVTYGGSGYVTPPTVTVNAPVGSGAIITAGISGGSVVVLNVLNAGSGYTSGATLTIGAPPSNGYQVFASTNYFVNANFLTNGNNVFAGTLNGNATTAASANSFSGALSGDVTGTQGATVVSSVGGQSAASVAAGVIAANSATSSNAANKIVARDGSGNFSAGTVTLSGGLNLPTTTALSGIIYSGGNRFLHNFGTGNFFAGQNAGNLTMTGFGDTGTGFGALANDTSGSFNTAIGYQALAANTNGDVNTAVGYRALAANASGINNTANGGFALAANVTGNNNTASGYNALGLNVAGSGNTASGYEALNANFNGNMNTAYGFSALLGNKLSSYNTAVGAAALQSTTNGSDNTAVGYQALYNNTIGAANTATGEGSLYWMAGGFYNTANGYQSLFSLTNGDFNTAVGYAALFSNISGHHNTALGYQAGYNLTTGHYNIDIGNPGNAGESGIIRIGSISQTNAFIAGIAGVPVTGPPVQVNGSGQLGVAPSSARFKQDIRPMEDASEVLYDLQPVTFRYQPGIDPAGTPQFGLIAEEVAEVDSDLVLRDAQDRIFTVRYEAINAMLLNEFLKQHHKVAEQSAEIDQLKRRLESLEKALLSQKGN